MEYRERSSRLLLGDADPFATEPASSRDGTFGPAIPPEVRSAYADRWVILRDGHEVVHAADTLADLLIEPRRDGDVTAFVRGARRQYA